MDAALAAPLVDSSPFSLRDDCGMDTVCLADEAQRVAANLAAAAAAGAYSPGQGEQRKGNSSNVMGAVGCGMPSCERWVQPSPCLGAGQLMLTAGPVCYMPVTVCQ
jgi:hypothetical protein